jgi:protein involved in polysaccharide export with SLBB domain
MQNMRFLSTIKAVGGFLAGAAMACMLVAGCSSTRSQMPDAGESGTKGHQGSATLLQANPSALRVGELLGISFADTANPLPPYEGRIRDDGKITLMHNQEFMAAGRSISDLEKEIHERYVPRFYVNLTVTVKAQDRFFYVEGEVKNPSRQEYRGDITIVGAVSAASGLTDFADPKKIKILRGDKTIIVNYIKAKANPKLDVPIYPGDRISVPKSWW